MDEDLPPPSCRGGFSLINAQQVGSNGLHGETRKYRNEHALTVSRSLGWVKQRLPRRRLVDWTPEDGDGQEWLARLAAEGWVPEHRTGSDTVINGRRVRRFAMIERPECGRGEVD